jgi:hypothetical protein
VQRERKQRRVQRERKQRRVQRERKQRGGGGRRPPQQREQRAQMFLSPVIIYCTYPQAVLQIQYLVGVLLLFHGHRIFFADIYFHNRMPFVFILIV